jgi:RNA recognition motif-containing protein
MKLYVGNLSFDTSEADLRDIFEQFGTVRETRVINDRETGRSRGFAFVTMGNDAEGRAAIGTLHGKQFAGRTITVKTFRRLSLAGSPPCDKSSGRSHQRLSKT